MFIERLLNQGNAPLLEQQLRFMQTRQRLIAENITNLSTPGYRQKDVDEGSFVQELRDRLAARKSAPPGSVSFDDILARPINPDAYVVFHDRNNRSPEQLMSDMQKNGLRHNLIAELLRKAYGSIENALRERVS
jgi:flagellar basal-body rod protein FlgB